MTKPYSVECVGHRWATQAVPHATLEQALAHAKAVRPDCIEVRVYSHLAKDGATGFQGAVGAIVAKL